MSREKTLENARVALDNNILWRAKEILQGNISSHGYDSEIFECYGQVLLRMGDDIEAGKYLFLSGARNEEYVNATNKYLKRFSHTSLANLHSNFPRAIRRLQLRHLPSVVITTLKEKDFTDQQLSEALEEKKTGRSDWKGKVILGGFLLYSDIHHIWNWHKNYHIMDYVKVLNSTYMLLSISISFMLNAMA
ncbi:MAG: DUF6584 family protein [Nitrospirales bacterium]